MAENSKIEWCHHTLNPWRGCAKVSAGCANCYAETMSAINPKTLGMWGPNGTRVVAAEAQWKLPLKWDKAAKAAGERHRVFCASLADVFEDWKGDLSNASGGRLWVSRCVAIGDVPFWFPERPQGDFSQCRPLRMADVRARLFRLIDETPNLDWLLLTKRPENVHRMCFEAWCKKVPGHVSQNEGDGRVWKFPPNVWLGTSVENKATLTRIETLREIPAAVRFLSLEPLLEDLGPLDLTGISWAIIGGESGPGARPMQAEWVRSLRDQCQAAGVAFFFKQWGGTNKKATGRELDGRTWDEFPQLTPSAGA